MWLSAPDAEPGMTQTGEMGFYQEQILPRGCHIDRPIGRLVTDAGLELTRLDNYYLNGPRAFGYMFDGVAVKPAGPALDAGMAGEE
jgi:hypothetical protein